MVKLDFDHPDLKAFYWKISTKTKVDQDKLMHELKKVFKEQAEVIWPMIRKIFGHFKHPITFHDFCHHITKFISSEIDPCKEAFFSFVDLNKDKLVCETDLFRVIKSLKSDETSQMMIDDLMLVLKMINSERKYQGKEDKNKLYQRKSVFIAEEALKHSKLQCKVDYGQEIKDFLN